MLDDQMGGLSLLVVPSSLLVRGGGDVLEEGKAHQSVRVLLWGPQGMDSEGGGGHGGTGLEFRVGGCGVRAPRLSLHGLEWEEVQDLGPRFMVRWQWHICIVWSHLGSLSKSYLELLHPSYKLVNAFRESVVLLEP